MAIRVQATFVFMEDEFEHLSFEKKGDIIEKMLSHPDWDVETLSIELMEVNMDSDDNSDEKELDNGSHFLGHCGDCDCKRYEDCKRTL